MGVDMPVVLSQINKQIAQERRANALSGVLKIGGGLALAATSTALSYAFICNYGLTTLLRIMSADVTELNVANIALYGVPAVVAAAGAVVTFGSGVRDLLRTRE